MPSRSNEEELKNLLAGHTVVSGVYDASKSPFDKGEFRGNMDVNGCEASLGYARDDIVSYHHRLNEATYY